MSILYNNEIENVTNEVYPMGCDSGSQGPPRTHKQKMEDYMNELSSRITRSGQLCSKENEMHEYVFDTRATGAKRFALNTYNGKSTGNPASILTTKSTVADLKHIAKSLRIKLTGTKRELTDRICCHLYFSSFIIKIQKVFRGHLQRVFNSTLHGPAYANRQLCVNQTDFLTMEEMASIPARQFFSYKDVDGFIYGFDIISLYNLLLVTGSKKQNPYNRNTFPEEVTKNLGRLIQLGRILNSEIETEIKDEPLEITSEKNLELRVLGVFQNMNILGNYSEPTWFMDLDRVKLMKFVREMFDIWNYRLQITPQMKCTICPPHGNPFRNVHLQDLRELSNIDAVREKVIEVVECLVNTGIDHDSKCLGAYYVLGALTLVNLNAAISLPWLYQSVSYNY